MVLTCCVTGCYNRGKRNKVSFYLIPAVRNHQGSRTAALSYRRRLEWVARINRKNWTPKPHHRVCEDHFLTGIKRAIQYCVLIITCKINTGKPAVLEDDTNPDWVPSLKMGYEIPVSVSADPVIRYARAQARHKNKLRIEYAEETAVAVEPIASALPGRCWYIQISTKSLCQVLSVKRKWKRICCNPRQVNQ